MRRQQPIDDPDSFFAAVDPDKTHATMDALRAAGIQFDASVNPRPQSGEAECDVFWFWKADDHAAIQRIIAGINS